MKEIKNLRKRNEKHFLNKDGSITCYLYDEDIHYLKNGQYENIDNTLIDNELFLTNKANAFRATFSKDKLSKKIVDITKDNFYLKMYLKTNKNSKLNLISQNNSISYKNILEDIDFDYQVISTKLKESIILKNKNNIPNCLAFTIDTNLKLELVNNKIIAKNENQAIFEIARPYMWDKENNYNYNISYDLKQVDSKYLLTLNLDRNWLKTANYPVVIDPTIVNKDSEDVYDAYVFSWDKNYVYQNDMLKIGLDPNESTDIYLSLLKYRLPNIGAGCEVINAEGILYSHESDYSNNDNNDFINIYAMNEDWNENSINFDSVVAKSDNNIEEFFLPIRSKKTGNDIQIQENRFNITNLVKKWYAGKPNYGIMLKTKMNNWNCKVYTFYSKENNVNIPGLGSPKPSIIITYRNLNGLEDYMSYTSQSYTNGMSYINNMTGNLTAVFNLNKTISGKYPINLNLIYNTNDIILNNEWGYGYGWKLNFHETLKEIKIDNTDYLEYLDADSTIHYFVHDYDDNNNMINDKYVDEDGLGLIAKFENGQYIITDKDTNKSIFAYKSNNTYYLTKLINTNNSEVNIQYNSQNKITKIIDGNNSQININYKTNSTVITSDYTTTTINYSNNKITSIVTK